MVNGDFGAMSDREILVKLATEFSAEIPHLKKEIKRTNDTMEDHVDFLRQTLINYKADHRQDILEIDNKLCGKIKVLECDVDVLKDWRTGVDTYGKLAVVGFGALWAVIASALSSIVYKIFALTSFLGRLR